MPRKVPANYIPRKTRGVPPKKIDWDRVDKLLECQCPGTEIAAAIKVGYNTLLDRCKEEKGVNFSEYSQSIKSIGKSLLREAQMQLALEKDRGMLIHLGEHVLEQGKQKETAPPHEDVNATRHALMIAMAEIDKLKEELNAYKPKAEQELRGSDAQV